MKLTLRDLLWLVLTVGLTVALHQETSACGRLWRRYQARPCAQGVRSAFPAQRRPPIVPLPRLVGLRAQVLDMEHWRELRDDEALHDDDDVRHSPVLDPDDVSDVVLIRMLKRPIDDSNAPWEEFARAENGERWVYGKAGTGEWLVTVEVHFKNGRVARLTE